MSKRKTDEEFVLDHYGNVIAAVEVKPSDPTPDEWLPRSLRRNHV